MPLFSFGPASQVAMFVGERFPLVQITLVRPGVGSALAAKRNLLHRFIIGLFAAIS